MLMDYMTNVYKEQEDADFYPNEGVGTFTKVTNEFIVSKSDRYFVKEDINRSIIFNEGNKKHILRIVKIINTKIVIVEENNIMINIYDAPFKMLKSCRFYYDDGNMDIVNSNINVSSLHQSNNTLNIHTRSIKDDVSSVTIIHDSNGKVNNRSMNMIHNTGNLDDSGVNIVQSIHINDLNSSDNALVSGINISTTNRSSCVKDGITINDGFTFPLYIYSNVDRYSIPKVYTQYSTVLLFNHSYNYSYNKDNIVIKDGVVKLSGKESHLLAKFSFNDNLVDSVQNIEGKFMCGQGSFSKGKIEKCVELTGKYFIQIKDDKISSSVGSVGCWVKLNSVDGLQGIFRNGIVPADSGYGIIVKDGLLSVCHGDSSTCLEYEIIAGVWFHVIYSWDESKINVYINGDKLLSKNYVVGKSKNIIIIGANKGITNSKDNMNGFIDEFFIRDRSMSDKEANDIYKSEDNCFRLKTRSVNEKHYVETTYPLNIDNFNLIDKHVIDCDVPANTNIYLETSTDRNIWVLNDNISDLDCREKLFIRFGIISNHALRTPRIRSCTFISDLHQISNYPLKFKNNINEVLIGSPVRFDKIKVLLDNNNNKSSNISLFYWKGGWKHINAVDNTFGLEMSGTISFTNPSDWISTNKIGKYIIDKLYYVRIVYNNVNNIPCSINNIEVNIPDHRGDFFINKDCSVHIPLLKTPQYTNSIYRDVRGQIAFNGSDNIKRSLSSFDIYTGKIEGKISSIKISKETKIDPTKMEEGFNIIFKDIITKKSYLCTILDSKWKFIEFL